MWTRFPLSVQSGPGTHLASYTVGTWSFSRVKRPGCGVNHPRPSSAEVKGSVELYLYFPSAPLWLLYGELYLCLLHISNERSRSVTLCGLFKTVVRSVWVLSSQLCLCFVSGFIRWKGFCAEIYAFTCIPYVPHAHLYFLTWLVDSLNTKPVCWSLVLRVEHLDRHEH